MAIDGSYRVVVEAMGKKVEGIVEVTTNGSKAEGVVHALGMDVPLQNGKVSGQTVTGVVEGASPIGRLKCKVSATVDGDKVTGTLKSLLVSAKFNGVRIEG